MLVVNPFMFFDMTFIFILGGKYLADMMTLISCWAANG